MGLLNIDKADDVLPSWKLCLFITDAGEEASWSFFNFFWCVFLGSEALECFIMWGFGFSTEGGLKEVFRPPPEGLGGKGGGCWVTADELLSRFGFCGDCLTRLTTVALAMLTCWDLGWVRGGLLSKLCWTGPNCFSYTLCGLSLLLEWPLSWPILP